MEINNSIDYVKAYWECRSIGEAERLKRKRSLAQRHELASGGRTLFRPNAGKPLDTAWWPAALRSHEFDSERNRFEKTRAAMLAAESDASVDLALKDVFAAYDDLTEAFHRRHAQCPAEIGQRSSGVRHRQAVPVKPCRGTLPHPQRRQKVAERR